MNERSRSSLWETRPLASLIDLARGRSNTYIGLPISIHPIFPFIEFLCFPFMSLLFFYFMKWFTDNPRDLTKIRAVIMLKVTDNTDTFVSTRVTLTFSAEEYKIRCKKRF
jgi:hypothetical protein